MERARPSRGNPVAWVWLGTAVVGVLALAAGLAARSWWLNPAFQRSPFRWTSILAILIAAGCAVVLARRERGKSRLLLAIGLAYIAVDNALGLHQRLAADLDLRALTSLEEGAVPLFPEEFHERRPRAGGDVPVDRPHVVAGPVLADLL